MQSYVKMTTTCDVAITHHGLREIHSDDHHATMLNEVQSVVVFYQSATATCIGHPCCIRIDHFLDCPAMKLNEVHSVVVCYIKNSLLKL